MKFSIMDQTGHSSESFETANKVDLDSAMARFNELMQDDRRFTAAAKKEGETNATVIRAFDPEAKEIVFVPPLQGG
jgi:hypothetical protein